NVRTKDTNAKDLARMIVGREVLLRVEKDDANPSENVLNVRNLSVAGKHGEAVNDISFNVRAGEIVGIAGIEGNGQTELIEAIAGLMPVSGGSIEFSGSNKTSGNITAMNARQRKELGIGHVPEDRHKRGLLLNFDLAENSMLGVHYRPPVASAGGLLNNSAINRRASEIVENFDVRPRNIELPAKALSGGNQQKLIIGREFGLNPKLLLVSQPTRGVDIGAIEFIHRKLIALRDAGTAVLLVSAELEEVTALADRLLVMREGKIVGEVNPKETSNEEIGLMMTGGN
ncbi:MAG: ATP-binding cassette domain-containing protein, partial [Pyrinomonadaceae bacterium]